MGVTADLVLDELHGLRRAYPDDDLMPQVLAAILAPEDVVTVLARGTDDSDPWVIWRDPDAVPAEFLAWLGQQVGVHFQPGDSEQSRRDQLKDPAGFDEGKTSALVAAVRQTLTGMQAVRVLKNVSGSMWRSTVVTRTAETPDPDATLAAALRFENAGARITHVITDFALIDDWTRPIDDVSTHIDDLTLGDVT